ncbi:MAG: cysteine--tRNA ligase [Pseudomonadota bacterium]|nr:cysteine--tRNA ligase [Pseudomonadota bacterium]
MYLYNSLTAKKEVFEPLVEGKVSLYVCGLTVYDSAHIGHLRTMLVFDLLVRFFRSQHIEVTYVRNITDVDDKIINRANQMGISTTQLTEAVIAEIAAEERTLGLIKPDAEPKASEYIDKMIQLIQVLEEKGYAYVAESGDVCFSVTKYSDYGELSGQKVHELIKGRRVSDTGKAESSDFVLWKLSKPSEPSWESPWGEGRPGWHIECSAMAGDLLGDTFDLHGGGVDLKFPHHENERAQSCCATGGEFAKHWMHVGHLHVNHEKMSKSLGNFITIKDALKCYHPEVLKLFLLKTHYAQPFNYSESGLKEAQTVLLGFYLALANQSLGELDEEHDLWKQFQSGLSDDLNVSKSLAVMHQVVNMLIQQQADTQMLSSLLVNMGRVFGILSDTPLEFLQCHTERSNDVERISQLVDKRLIARNNKDYETADAIRLNLADEGVVIEDRAGGAFWYFADAGIKAATS